MARQDIVQGRCRSLVRDVHDVDACTALEHLPGKVGRPANARRHIVQLARLGLGQRDKFFEVFSGNIRVYHQHAGGRHELDNGCQVFLSVVFKILVDRHVRRVSDRLYQQGITVRVGSHDLFRRDVRPRARLVFDNDRLAPGLPKLDSDEPRDDVCRPSRRVAHHNRDGPGRITTDIFGCTKCGHRMQGAESSQQKGERHVQYFWDGAFHCCSFIKGFLSASR